MPHRCIVIMNGTSLWGIERNNERINASRSTGPILQKMGKCGEKLHFQLKPTSLGKRNGFILAEDNMI